MTGSDRNTCRLLDRHTCRVKELSSLHRFVIAEQKGKLFQFSVRLFTAIGSSFNTEQLLKCKIVSVMSGIPIDCDIVVV